MPAEEGNKLSASPVTPKVKQYEKVNVARVEGTIVRPHPYLAVIEAIHTVVHRVLVGGLVDDFIDTFVAENKPKINWKWHL